MSFADNLKKLRSEHRLTQEDLADLLHVSRQAVSKWEQGLSYPEAENLILLSKKFGASLRCIHIGKHMVLPLPVRL